MAQISQNTISSTIALPPREEGTGHHCKRWARFGITSRPPVSPAVNKGWRPARQKLPNEYQVEKQTPLTGRGVLLLGLDSEDRVPPSVRIISRSLFLSVEALGAIALARCPGGLPRRPAGPGGLRLIRVTVTGDGA